MKNNKLPSLIVLMILTVITVLFWISFSVYRTLTKTTEPPVGASVLAPIVPSLDTQTMDNVENKIYP